MSKVEFVLYHGWGLSPLFWEPLIETFPDDLKCFCFNRGYFDLSTKKPGFSGESERQVLVSHSFGLHQIEKRQIEATKYLIIFAGFVSFHPSERKELIISKQKFRIMSERLQTVPKQQMMEVYQSSAFPQENTFVVPDTINKNLLIQDLQKLTESSLSLENLQGIPNILILHGDKDQIVPLEKGVALQKQLPHAHLTVLNGAGHFLPHTHSQWSAQEILAFLDNNK